MPRVLVTGGAGFIGRQVVRSLHDMFHECEIDIFDTDEAMCKNARHISLFGRFIRKLDNSTFFDINRGGRVYSHIVHAAAISDTRCNDYKALMETNYEMTCRILDHKASSRLVAVSSASVYGDLSCSEYSTFQPQTAYAASKVFMDNMVRQHGCAAVVRPFNVYGPGEFSKKEHTRSIMYRVAHAATDADAEPLGVHSMSAVRDFISVKDVGDSIVSILLNIDPVGPCAVYNLGTGRPMSIESLVQAAVSEVGHSRWFKHVDNPYESGQYQMHSHALFPDKGRPRPYDPSKFEDPKDGLVKLIRYMKLREFMHEN